MWEWWWWGRGKGGKEECREDEVDMQSWRDEVDTEVQRERREKKDPERVFEGGKAEQMKVV